MILVFLRGQGERSYEIYDEAAKGLIMKVMISGSHGLIGTALKDHLEHAGDLVVALARDLSQPLDFKGVDAVVHLAGEPISNGRWNRMKKQRIRTMSSRINEKPNKRSCDENHKHKP